MSKLINAIKRASIEHENRKKRIVVKSGYVSKDCALGEWCQVGSHVLIENNVSIGKYTYLNSGNNWITVGSNVTIGCYCSIAPGVSIAPGNHCYDYVSTHPFLYNSYYSDVAPNDQRKAHGLKDDDVKTVIGNDVWIGIGAIIKRGVTIGNGAVIAAGAIVTKDVPDYAIVGGNPAKVIKYRTSKENIVYFKNNIEKMWWNWDCERLSNHLGLLYDFDKYRTFLEDETAAMRSQRQID